MQQQWELKKKLSFNRIVFIRKVCTVPESPLYESSHGEQEFLIKAYKNDTQYSAQRVQKCVPLEAFNSHNAAAAASTFFTLLE